MSGSATIVVVPRERFSHARASLESLYEHTAYPFQLVYVDGRSPRPVARYLEKASVERGFRLVRTSHFLTPNQARNLGTREADTDYVVFVDNDVIVTPNWLRALVECADETGAWVVGPLYCIGKPEHRCIRMAGGVAHIEEENGARSLKEQHRHQHESLPDVRVHLKRQEVELVEFHTALVRRDVFDRLGPLDERLYNSRQHIDLCLSVRAAGGSVFFEPDSVLTYVPPPPFARSDLFYYMLCWSDHWCEATVLYFNEKWKVEGGNLRAIEDWTRPHRRVIFQGFENGAAKIVGRRAAKSLTKRVARVTEAFVIPHALKRSRGFAPPKAS